MRLIDADRLVKTIEKAQMESRKVNVLSLINDAPTEGVEKEASNYGAGWMDGYNHAIDQIFKELNYLLKNHVIEELRKRIKR